MKCMELDPGKNCHQWGANVYHENAEIQDHLCNFFRKQKQRKIVVKERLKFYSPDNTIMALNNFFTNF